jgi:hypothetical protein
MERSSSLLSGIVAGCALLIGCAVFDGGEAYPLATQPPVSGSGGFAALVSGVLAIDLDRGCVWLEEDGRRYPVVWPTGTTAEEDPFVVKLANGEARPGDRLSGGGGYRRPAEVPELAACADEGEVAVFNPNAKIEVTPR